MNRVLYIILLALFAPLPLSAADTTSWRTPTQGELGSNTVWRKQDPYIYLLAKGDFDGDGKEDTARLLINDKENKMSLFVTLSTSEKVEPLVLETIDDKRLIEVMGIAAAKSGTYITPCGRGYWSYKADELPQIQLDRPAISVFWTEGVNFYLCVGWQ